MSDDFTKLLCIGVGGAAALMGSPVGLALAGGAGWALLDDRREVNQQNVRKVYVRKKRVKRIIRKSVRRKTQPVQERTQVQKVQELHKQFLENCQIIGALPLSPPEKQYALNEQRRRLMRKVDELMK